MLPFVSCIMPTRNRPDFVRRAVAMFVAQDYPNKQLVIVEDGDCDAREISAADPNGGLPSVSRYIHLGKTKWSIGEKRNLACEMAMGDLIAHWDDDDWHSPRRLSIQVEALRAQGGRLCAADRVVFYDPTAGAMLKGRAWLYKSIRNPWLAGQTFLYEKSLWREQPFPPLSNGEDVAFLDAAFKRGVKLAVIEDPSFYVATIHPGNADPKTPDAQWRGFDVETVRAWMSATSERTA